MTKLGVVVAIKIVNIVAVHGMIQKGCIEVKHLSIYPHPKSSCMSSVYERMFLRV